MKFKIVTLGCKVNTYESEVIKEQLLNAGYELTDYYADIIIINTCTVTNSADAKSQKLIRSTKRENPGSIVIVCGCMAENKQTDLTELGIDILIGNQDKSKIIELIEDYKKNNKKIINFYDIQNQDFESMKVNKFTRQIRAFIKIQDGCNNYCSYCIIPYVRGNLRNKDFDSIIKEASVLAENNHKEIVLTGIHTGSYGIGTDKNLSDVIKELNKIEKLKRIRVSSIEITELTESFLEELKNNEKMCDHLHIPLQSGDDRILKLMNRKYDTKKYEEIINKIREIKPNINITTDVIVGFPDETEEEFKNTCEFCKKIKFSKIHVFPYSKRDGTVSATLNNHLSIEIKKDRVKILMEISKKLEEKYQIANINNNIDVLIEKYEKGYSIGHTSNYLLIKIKEELNINEIYPAKIIKFEGDKLVGKISKSEEK